MSSFERNKHSKHSLLSRDSLLPSSHQAFSLNPLDLPALFHDCLFVARRSVLGAYERVPNNIDAYNVQQPCSYTARALLEAGFQTWPGWSL